MCTAMAPNLCQDTNTGTVPGGDTSGNKEPDADMKGWYGGTLRTSVRCGNGQKTVHWKHTVKSTIVYRPPTQAELFKIHFQL